MKWTQDQTNALAGMLEWSKKPIKEETDLLYTLDGAAGTGKTTIVREFLNQTDIRKSKIAVTAPTHKAKKVIQVATDFRAETIQKLLGLRPDINIEAFDSNNPIFNPIGENEIGFYSVVIIDESSMLNKAAYELITELAFKYDVRILFLGDAFQLPPVNETISKVFSHVPNKSTLTTVVRQSEDNPMSDILKMLRVDVQYGTDNGIKELINRQKEKLGEKGFKVLSSGDFSDNLLEYYCDSEYALNTDYVKFLSYTNENIELWSSALRKRLLKEEADNILNIGEYLIGYSSITDRRTNTLIIENSEDYIVTNVTTGTSEEGVVGLDVSLENSKGNTRHVFIVTDIASFKAKALPLYRTAKKKRGYAWVQYYRFKDKHLLLENVAIDPKKSIKAWGNLLAKKDLYYGYGCTVHKSQGSTYENVALNLKDLYKQADISERARLIYVALSRSKNMNLILAL